MALLAELAEREALGEKAAVYAEIRRLGGVPMVALIFRHLATRPGVIEWAWNAIGPAWRSGLLQETAWRIAREAPLVPIARMHEPALAALGVDARARREIDASLEAYNRANPMNMLSVLCLLRMLEGRSVTPAKAGGQSASWTPPPAPGPLVPMIDVTSMAPEMSALLDLVAAPGEPGGARVVQSLYRHLAQHAAYLALAITLLRQRFDDGSIDAATSALATRMNEAADGIARSLGAPAVPCPELTISPPTENAMPASSQVRTTNGRGRLFDSVLDTVGDTPCIRINNVAPKSVRMYVKAEAFNPAASVKDRLALNIIEAAERKGH